MKRIVKWGLIGTLGLCVLAGIGGALGGGGPASLPTATPGPSSTPRPTATLGPSSTPRPTATPGPSSTPRPTAAPTATLTADEHLVQVAKKAMNVAPTTARVLGDVAVVERTDEVLTEKLFVASADVGFRQLAPAVFAALPEVNLLTLKVSAPFTDQYGQESTEVALRFTITRELAGKVNWRNIGHGLGPLLTTEPGCTLYVHPGLAAVWAEYAR